MPKTLLTLATVLALTAAGCGSDTPERQNARQTPGAQVDRVPAEVYAMPDHYNNVASKCDRHGHRIFITSNKDQAPSNLVVIADPSCGR
ncbi:hypothetical protein DSM112329_03747 [Paraconexibacter sp. AEG42_29]|uniref:Secreted protein n=1 Tax=Paraconexibacter sp. AEG42_29 TaxID=2997339 RepID=A0AAU7AYZ4_9ACTN